MSLIDKLTETVEVYHLTDEGGNKEGYLGTADITTQGFFVPVTAEDVALSEGQYSQGYNLFTPIVDIRVSDKVVINSVDYKVAGVKTFNFGSDPHLEIIIYDPKS